jgi:hypothetical protein
MSAAPVGMVAQGTNPASRMDAWNGFALKGTDVYCVRQGGHSDYFGNEVLRINLATDAPAWTMIKASTPNPSVVTDNNSRYTDGTPSAVHGYYTQRYIPQRNWVFSCGTTAMSLQGGTNGDCVIYDISTNTYLPPGTVPTLNVGLLPGFGVWDDPMTGNVYQVGGYQVNRWNQATNNWTMGVGSLPKLYGFPSVACFDSTRRRGFILAGDSGARQPYLFDVTTNTTIPVNPTGDLTVVNSNGGFGITYCPATDRFYAMVGNSGADLYEINPTTFAIGTKATIGTPPPTTGNGVWGRFHYVAELGGIIYFPRYAANAWFLRLH